MITWITGFNLFHQWSKADRVVTRFTAIENHTYFEIMFLGWSYNILRIRNDVCMSGLYTLNKTDLQAIPLPRNINSSIDVVIAGTDRYLLLLDKISQRLWKCVFKETSGWDWIQIPPFWDVETESSEENPSESNKRDIIKIKASPTMNLCLTSGGLVFNIPQRVNIEQCVGKIIDMDCGYEHAIILTDQGNVYTWGNGRRCQLGHGDLNNIEEPELVEALAGVKIVCVRAGGWHSCALSETGDMYVWGWNQSGQLGIHHDHFKDPKQYKSQRNYTEDFVTSLAVPTLVDIFESETSEVPLECDIVDVACGSKHTVIVLGDNTVWSAGSNAYGQLGLDNKQVPLCKYFSKVHSERYKCNVLCGAWSTVISCET